MSKFMRLVCRTHIKLKLGLLIVNAYEDLSDNELLCVCAKLELCAEQFTL